MSDYIKRESAIKLVQGTGYANQVKDNLLFILRTIPAADVWEVVHCADCAHAEESLVNGCVYCNEMERARIKEGFCAWGERKTDDG